MSKCQLEKLSLEAIISSLQGASNACICVCSHLHLHSYFDIVRAAHSIEPKSTLCISFSPILSRNHIVVTIVDVKSVCLPVAKSNSYDCLHLYLQYLFFSNNKLNLATVSKVVKFFIFIFFLLTTCHLLVFDCCNPLFKRNASKPVPQ